jgi:hypothetical protein
MNTNRWVVVGATVVVAGGLLTQSLGYHGGVLQIHPKWLSLAILAAAVGVGAFVWAGRK